MALEDLTQKIIADAHAQAERIRSHATETVARLDKEGKEEVAALRAAYLAETERLVEKQAVLETQHAQQEARALLESAQRTLLNETFTKALAEIVGLSDAEYVKYIEPQLAHVATVKEQLQVVRVPSSRVQVTKDLCARLGLDVAVEGVEGMKGGFVAVGELSEYDARLEQRVIQVQRANESKVARILFGA